MSKKQVKKEYSLNDKIKYHSARVKSSAVSKNQKYYSREWLNGFKDMSADFNLSAYQSELEQVKKIKPRTDDDKKYVLVHKIGLIATIRGVLAQIKTPGGHKIAYDLNEAEEDERRKARQKEKQDYEDGLKGEAVKEYKRGLRQKKVRAPKVGIKDESDLDYFDRICSLSNCDDPHVIAAANRRRVKAGYKPY